MVRFNPHYGKLQSSYLFSDIARRIAKFQEANPDRNIIRLGIGDVTQPLPSACVEAFHKAVDEMATENGFRGYGPEQGYDFLREAIAENDFRAVGLLHVLADQTVEHGVAVVHPGKLFIINDETGGHLLLYSVPHGNGGEDRER